MEIIKICGLDKVSFLLLMLSTIASSTLHAAPDEFQQIDGIPSEIAEVLNANALSLNVVGLTYSIKYDYATKGLRRKVSEEFDLYYEDGKLYVSGVSKFPKATGSKDVRSVKAFDGDVFYHGSGAGDGSLILTKSLGENQENKNAKNFKLRFGYLEDAGYRLPETIAQWKEASIESDVTALGRIAEKVRIRNADATVELEFSIPEPAVEYAKDLDLDEYRKQFAESDAVEMRQALDHIQNLRLKTMHRIVQISLDPEKRFAVTRRVEKTESGRLLFETTCDDFKYFRNKDIWLPYTCIKRQFLSLPMELSGFKEVPDVTTVTLKEVFFDKRPDMEFAVAIPAGTHLIDRSTKAGDDVNGYIVPTDNATLREVAGSARKRSLLIVVNVIIVVVLCAAIWWRAKSGTNK